MGTRVNPVGILISNDRPRRKLKVNVQWNPTVKVYDPHSNTASFIRLEQPLKSARPRSTDLLARYAPQPDATGRLFQGWLDKYEENNDVPIWNPFWVTLQAEQLSCYTNPAKSAPVLQLELGASSSVGLGRQFHIDGGLFVKFAFRVTVEEQQYIFSASCLEYVSQWMSSIEQAIPRNILPNPSKSTRKKKTLNKIKAKSGQISGKLFSRSGQTPVGCKSNFSELSTETLDFKDNPKFLALCDKSPQKLSPSDLQQIEQLLQISSYNHSRLTKATEFIQRRRRGEVMVVAPKIEETETQLPQRRQSMCALPTSSDSWKDFANSPTESRTTSTLAQSDPNIRAVIQKGAPPLPPRKPAIHAAFMQTSKSLGAVEVKAKANSNTHVHVNLQDSSVDFNFSPETQAKLEALTTNSSTLATSFAREKRLRSTVKDPGTFQPRKPSPLTPMRNPGSYRSKQEIQRTPVTSIFPSSPPTLPPKPIPPIPCIPAIPQTVTSTPIVPTPANTTPIKQTRPPPPHKALPPIPTSSPHENLQPELSAPAKNSNSNSRDPITRLKAFRRLSTTPLPIFPE